MSVQSLRLDCDFLKDGFYGFVERASQAYPNKDIVTAVNSCRDAAWTAVKDGILNNPDRPVFRRLAQALERAIQQAPELPKN